MPTRSVNIAKLKNHLSRYLEEVRRGEEIVVCDRKVPIARIVPLDGLDELSVHERYLVATGQLRLPKRKPTPEFWKRFWAMRAPRLSAKRAVAALLANREEERY